jgi:hypothetical protein
VVRVTSLREGESMWTRCCIFVQYDGGGSSKIYQQQPSTSTAASSGGSRPR